MRFFHLLPKAYWPVVLAEMYRVVRPGGFLIAELRNLFRGIAGGLFVEYRDRWLRAGRRRSYVWPHEVSGLFKDWAHIDTRGAGLDGLGRLSAIAPTPARRLHRITRYYPWQYLAKELFVKAYKSLR
jgi:SAM-dependent methyltransferase